MHPFLLRSVGVLPWLGLFASGVMAVVVTLFGTLALPHFVALFASAGQPLPWITRIVSEAWLLAWLAPLLVAACWYFSPTLPGRIVAGLLGMGAAVLGAVSVLFAMYLPYFLMGSLV